MWHLGYTVGLSHHDSDKEYKTIPLGKVSIWNRPRAKKLAFEKWEGIRHSHRAKLERFRNPKLIWVEPLHRNSRQKHKK